MPSTIADLPNEEWRWVVGYEGRYQVSNMGRVRSFRIINGGRDQRGRKTVRLIVDGKGKTYLVHRLVAIAFFGPRPGNSVIRHLDGNIWNNTEANLRYGTQKENIADEIIRGTFCGKIQAPAPKERPVDESKETWRMALSCGIEASSEGRIRKTTLIGSGKNVDGYAMTGLVSEDGISYAPVHRLVAAAFLGPRPVGYVIRHLDGDKSNNTVLNLAYGTVAENAADEVRNGRTSPLVKASSRRRLTIEQVRQIRERRASGDRNCEVAKSLGVSRELISSVGNGRSWTIREAGIATPMARRTGEQHHAHKLTAASVVEILRARQSGVSLLKLARTYKVSKPAILSIVQRKTWKHVAVESAA